MKAGRRITSLALLGSRIRLGSSMEEKKTFKQGRDDVRKRKVRRRSKRDATNHPSQGQQQVPQQKGTRLGGSTSVLLPEPRAKTMAQGVEVQHSPPAPQQEF